MVTHKSLSNLPPVVPLPYAPENKFLSKAEFVAKNRKRKEIEAKTKAFAEDLEKKSDVETEATPNTDEPYPLKPLPEHPVTKPVRKYKKAV